MPRRTAQEAARTRAALIDAGVTYFSAHSYQDAALSELVGGMGITRGALYHHFGSKQGFFEAVLERVFQRLAEQIERASRDQGDGWAGLEAGCRAFMRAATDESFRRIALLDGPAVLGWQVWKQIDDRTSAMTLRDGLAALERDGQLAMGDVDALAAALSGAMNELALWVANEKARPQALARAEAVIASLLATFAVR